MAPLLWPRGRSVLFYWGSAEHLWETPRTQAWPTSQAASTPRTTARNLATPRLTQTWRQRHPLRPGLGDCHVPFGFPSRVAWLIGPDSSEDISTLFRICGFQRHNKLGSSGVAQHLIERSSIPLELVIHCGTVPDWQGLQLSLDCMQQCTVCKIPEWTLFDVSTQFILARMSQFLCSCLQQVCSVGLFKALRTFQNCLLEQHVVMSYHMLLWYDLLLQISPRHKCEWNLSTPFFC